MERKDFSEVAHTGGKAMFSLRSDDEGQVLYRVGYQHLSTAGPSRLVGIYAHPDGFPCGGAILGGIGTPQNPPPLPNCILVIMASDSQGKFGHECPVCKKHFRTESIPAKADLICPYCGLRAESHHFLTPAQLSYVAHYVETLLRAIGEISPDSTEEIVINMDAISDSVTQEPRSDFYYTSTTQQTEFNCTECGSYNDIRGRYGYCAYCAWRNSATSAREALSEVREQLNAGLLSASDAVKQAVSEFDSAARDFTEQLVARIPMKTSRARSLERLLFHNLDKCEELLKVCFDIDLLRGLSADRDFIRMMFFRRHAYEHDGGVASRRYVEQSGDSTAEEGILLRETTQNAHRFIGCLNRMISEFEKDFHDIFKPERHWIDIENARKERMAKAAPTQSSA